MSGSEEVVAVAARPRGLRWLMVERVSRVSVDGEQQASGLRWDCPPRVAGFVLPRRVVPEQILRDEHYVYVAGADSSSSSGLLLLYVTQGRAMNRSLPNWQRNPDAWLTVHRDRTAYFLHDAATGAVSRLPDEGRRHVAKSGKLGLVADPEGGDRHMIAELVPIGDTDQATLLCYTMGTDGWVEKELVNYSNQQRQRWGRNGVVSHAGKLWWVDLSNGLLACDPFADQPEMFHVPLPEGWDPKPLSLLDRDRGCCISLSAGRLRFLVIRNLEETLTLSMWTLMVDEITGTKWKHEYDAPFSKFWDDPSFVEITVPSGIALVHPQKPNVVYFFQDYWPAFDQACIYSVDVCQRKLLEVAAINLVPEFHSSQFVQGLELPLEDGDDSRAMAMNEGVIKGISEILAKAVVTVASQLQHEGTEGEDEELFCIPVPSPSWVILSGLALVSDTPGAHLVFDLKNPPKISRVSVNDLCSYSDHQPYIAALERGGGILVWTGQGAPDSPDFHQMYYMCSRRHSICLPDPPRSYDCRIGNIGLIVDPRCSDEYMVIGLRPVPVVNRAEMFCYSTYTDAWEVKEVSYSPEHPPFDCDGAISHDGKLWWLDLSHGLLCYDPMDDQPELCYVPLPQGCLMPVAASMDVDKVRCVKVSNSKLRFVQIHDDDAAGKVITAWTLADPEGPEWEHEYTVPFEDIWSDDSYTAARLPPKKVPNLALIHPKNPPDVIYLFQDNWIYALDVRARRVSECEHCSMDDIHDGFRSSRFVHAWDPPPKLFRLDPSSHNDEMGNVRPKPPNNVTFRLATRYNCPPIKWTQESEASEPREP